MNLIRIIHDLRRASGSNRKIEILKRHRDNEMWKKFLLYTYNMSESYGVSAPKTFDFDEEKIDEGMFSELDKLSNRQITGMASKALAIWLSKHYGEIPRLVLGRSIKAGVSTGIINKVYDNLIPIFKTMKGKDIPIVDYPVESSIKYDGVKVFAFVHSEEIYLKTSSGKKFDIDSLCKELRSAPYGVYEGELVHKDGKQIYRPVISGQLVSLLAGTVTDISDYTFYVYDYIRHSEWDLKKSYMKYEDRYTTLIEGFKNTIGDSAFVKPVDNLTLTNEQDVTNMFDFIVANGYEGTMHRYADDTYMWTGDKRTDRLIKKKCLRECELVCVGITPHTNPTKGNIGSLLCEGMVSDKIAGVVGVRVNVGIGLSKMDIQRDEDYFVGKVIECAYNSVTSSDGKYSLFLPRYKRIVGDL